MEECITVAYAAPPSSSLTPHPHLHPSKKEQYIPTMLNLGVAIRPILVNEMRAPGLFSTS